MEQEDSYYPHWDQCHTVLWEMCCAAEHWNWTCSADAWPQTAVGSEQEHLAAAQEILYWTIDLMDLKTIHLLNIALFPTNKCSPMKHCWLVSYLGAFWALPKNPHLHIIINYIFIPYGKHYFLLYCITKKLSECCAFLDIRTTQSCF